MPDVIPFRPVQNKPFFDAVERLMEKPPRNPRVTQILENLGFLMEVLQTEDFDYTTNNALDQLDEAICRVVNIVS